MNWMPGILAVGFMAPWLMAAGAAATSIPIVIHLLNKRRFRVIVWAAMDFLLAAQRRNARRLRFQRWLLLLLRIAALLVLGAAVAQLFLENSALGRLAGGGERAVIIVWDDSYSMAYQNPGKPSHFERSKKLILDYLANAPSSDAVAVVRASKGAEPLVPKTTTALANVKLAVQDVQVSDAGTDLAGALTKVATILKDEEKKSEVRTVVLLTDLSRSSLGGLGSGDAAREQLKEAVGKVRDLASLRVVDLGEADQVNMGLVGLRTARPVVVAGNPTELEVVARNGTNLPQVDVTVNVLVDGVIAESNRRFGKIEPGGTGSMRVGVTLPTAGRHVIEARIPTPDLLATDDVRRIVVDAKRELPLLLVDGSPGDGQQDFGGSTRYLQNAYSPMIGGKSASIWASKVITELELPTTPLAPVQAGGYAAVVLSDTGRLADATVANLKKYVESGGFLIVFPGNRTSAEALNATLGDNGAKLLPATVGLKQGPGAGGDTTKWLQFDPMKYAHPVLELFRNAAEGGQQTGLTTPQTWTYFKLATPADGSSETILKFTDGNPAVVLRQAGKGKVVLFATTADWAWTTWAPKPSFVEFMWELLYYGMSREDGGLTLLPGARIHLPADAAPAGAWSGPRNMRVQVSVETDRGAGMLTSGPLTAAGVYGPSGAPPVVAVNPDSDEADIRYVKPAEMAAAMGMSTGDFVSQPASLEVRTPTSGAGANPAGNLGRHLLLVALLIFCVEALCARLFSVYR